MTGKDLNKTELKPKVSHEIEAKEVVERISLKGIASKLALRYICKRGLISFRGEALKVQETELAHNPTHIIYWAKAFRSRDK